MNLNDFVKTEYVGKGFKTCIGVINIPKERNLYNSLRKHYNYLAKSAAKSFEEYYESYTDCSQIQNNAKSDFKKSISIIIEDIKNTYINLGKYDFDYETIYDSIEKFGCFEIFEESYFVFIDKAYEILGYYQAQREYREQRKENRSRWVGGTFGSTPINAISHQMDIYAMNAASGAVYSVANAVGNYFSELQTESDLKALFNSKQIRTMFIDGVYLSAFSIINAFIEILGKGYIWGIVNEDDSNKAQRLINNLNNNSFNEEQISEICREVIRLNPYNIEIYIYLLKKYGDDGSIGMLADYFGIDGFTNAKDEQATEYVKNNQGETESDAIKAKILLTEYCKKINLDINNDLECVKYIDSLIADFDLKYRTVDEVVCETREGADFSREELPKITEFMKDVKPLQTAPLLPYERNMQAKKENFERQFSSEVSKKYLDKINGYLDDFDKQFCNTKIFSSVSRKQAARDRALLYAKGLKFSNIEEFEKEYEKFKNFIQLNLGISIDEAVEAKQYLERKKSKLSNGGFFDLGGKFKDFFRK